jgi:hypothetical protein
MSNMYTVVIEKHYAGGIHIPQRVITLPAKGRGAAKLIALRRTYDALKIPRSVRLKERKARVAAADGPPALETDVLVERALT